MNDRDTTITTLRKEKRKIDERFARLKKEKEAIDATILYLMGGTQLSLEDFQEGEPQKAVGPTDAIRTLFNNNPSRHFSPGEIRNELRLMKKSGELESKSANILSMVHWILRGFVERGFVEKGGQGIIKWYRKVQT